MGLREVFGRMMSGGEEGGNWSEVIRARRVVDLPSDISAGVYARSAIYVHMRKRNPFTSFCSAF